MAKKKAKKTIKKSSKETAAEGRMWPGAVNKQDRDTTLKNRRKANKRNRGRPGA